MDLLRISREEKTSVQRNIFAPGAASEVTSTPRTSTLPGTPGSRGVEAAWPEEGGISAEPARPAFSVNLRYVGVIVSERRHIGLIILDGQALAVAEGEVVSEGVRIGKITAEEIEVILPDSSTRKFPLEGE